MAEMARPRPVEYYNPRPLILGLCFLWGIGVGFLLFYLAPPTETVARAPTPTDAVPPAPPPEPRDRQGQAPPITLVPETVDAPTVRRQTLEEIDLPPPAAALTTAGGLTGRTAPMPRPATARPPAAEPASAPLRPPRPTQPPIPDLLP
ncbi:MAG: hypothetical protein LIP77_05790 [Planctomycetes bacterium]|nr:hypothetical protein [Planctomycetota bacterium]